MATRWTRAAAREKMAFEVPILFSGGPTRRPTSRRANRPGRCVDSAQVTTTTFTYSLRSALAFILIWWLLARGGPSWAAAGAAGVLAALAALRFTAPRRSVALRWSRLPRFFVWFVAQSVAGGLDVARRAAARDMRLAPGLVDVDLGERAEGAQVLIALVVSLLPGTLAVRLDGRKLRLHALDTRLPIADSVRRLAHEVDLLLHPADRDPQGRE
jgi:multicomponent Na+:H+ antiporter subunit E